MQMLYNSPAFIVVRFNVPVPGISGNGEQTVLGRGGYEIVDRHSRREIYIEGALAEHFEQGVQALIASEPSEEEIDAFIEPYANLGQMPLMMH